MIRRNMVVKILFAQLFLFMIFQSARADPNAFARQSPALISEFDDEWHGYGSGNKESRFFDPSDKNNEKNEDVWFDDESSTIYSDIPLADDNRSNIDVRSYDSYFRLEWGPRMSDSTEVCIVNVERADVVFVVDVGNDVAQDAIPNLKHFIMSTLIVMELGKDKIRVGVISMGSKSSGVTEVVPISKGTSHRAVQVGLDRLVKGEFDFDYAKCLENIQNNRENLSNQTVIIISVFSSPIIQTRVVDGIMNDMASNIRDLSFYHVTLSTISILLRKEKITPRKEKTPLAAKVEVISEYGHFAASRVLTSVANKIRNRYGCDHCRPNPCAFGSVCVMTEHSYECACPEGFVSGVCEPCLKKPCNGSRCLLTGTGYRCDLCDPSPCMNGGKCYYGDDESVFCECADNFIGDTCALQCPNCPDGSICRIIDEKAVCECLEGFFGTNCIRNCDVMITCLNNGTCDFDVNQNPICRCVGDFYGPRCEYLCDQFTCQNGGSCGVSNSERICYCTPQFEGQFCDINKCDSYFNCVNGGKCGVSSQTNQIECQCLPPFTGVDCSIGTCSNYTCYHGGACELTGDFKPTCSCSPPYFGERCLDDPCSNKPCLNGGICRVESLSYNCECRLGFWGENCMNHPCIPDPCFNGGFCIPMPLGDSSGMFTFECLCSKFYTGPTCEVEMEIGNIGVINSTVVTSTNSVDSTTEISASSGSSSIKDNDPCNPNPCSFPCECKPSCKHSDGYVCISKDGRLGKTCSIDAPILLCGGHAITVTIDHQLLTEMLGKDESLGYFKLGWSENDGSSVFCKSVQTLNRNGNRIHKLIVPAPFTACGTETSMDNEKILTISNKIWFNINSTAFDMLTPVLTWYCNYTTQYKATTSLVPMIDNSPGSLPVRIEKYDPIKLQLCKMTSSCPSTCPPYLIVNPGAVYTVGQLINVLVQPFMVAGLKLQVVDFYLSCGSSPNSTTFVPIIDEGCPTGNLHSAMHFKEGSTCVTFQLPKMRSCNTVYLHAKFGVCEKSEVRQKKGFCLVSFIQPTAGPQSKPLKTQRSALDFRLACNLSSGTSCVVPAREKRSLSHEDLFGPLYIFPLYDGETQSNQKAVPQILNPGSRSSIIKGVNLQVESLDYVLVSILAVLAFLLCCFLVFLCICIKSRRYKLQA